MGVFLDLNCSDSLSPVDNSLNLQIYCGCRSCDVEMFILKCMSSVQEKYLVQFKLLNHHLLLVHDGTGTQQTFVNGNLLLQSKCAVFMTLIRDYLKFRNNFLKTSALFLNIFPSSLGLVFTTVEVKNRV